MRLRPTRSMFSTAAAASILLLAAACGSDSTETEDSTATPPAETSAPEATDDPAAAGETTSAYADGTYTASGSYPNPGGESSVSVELSLEGGVVTDLTVTPEASGTSAQYQQQFVGGINEQVVGANIDDLNVSRVSGSSLTSQGFNAAIEQIKSEAQA